MATKFYPTDAGREALEHCADKVPWKGRPNAGTMYAIEKTTGISRAVLNNIKNGLAIGPKTVATMRRLFGDGAVREENPNG